jgi:trk system potassium uptake protein TrkH
MIMPHGVFTPVYNKRIIHSSVIYAVLTLLLLFLLHIFVLIFILLNSNLAMGDSLELSINVLSNCGAHFFPLDISRLPHHLHWALSFGMLLGRLEFLTIWILFLPFFWRR